MKFSVARPILTQIKYQKLCVNRVYMLYNMGEKVVEIQNVSGDKSIFLLFCDPKTLNLSN